MFDKELLVRGKYRSGFNYVGCITEEGEFGGDISINIPDAVACGDLDENTIAISDDFMMIHHEDWEDIVKMFCEPDIVGEVTSGFGSYPIYRLKDSFYEIRDVYECNRDIIEKAMDTAGYYLDEDSVDCGKLRWVTKDLVGRMETGGWSATYSWLKEVVFDDPEVSDTVEKILREDDEDEA